MKTEKKKTTRIIAVFAFFLLIATASYGEPSSSPDFNQETPMIKLPTPVDFLALVYAEASKTVSVSFWTQFDKQSKDMQRQLRLVTVQPRDRKTTYNITCDWKQRTATVISNFLDINDQPEESRQVFKITNFNIQNVCLMRIDGNGGVDVITMSAEIGSFIETISNAPGFFQYNGTYIWYGTCRN
jgi:hypothetical protein